MIRRWAVLCLLLFPLVATPGYAEAQQTASLFVDPPSQTVARDQGPFEVRVMVKNVTNADGLGGYTLVMRYDPTILHARSITDSGLIGSTQNTTLCPSTNIDNRNGALGHFCLTIPILAQPGPTVTSPQVLVHVSFEPVGAGTTALDISETTIIDPHGNDLAASTANGQVSVGRGPQTPVQGPTGQNAATQTASARATGLPTSGKGPGGGSDATPLYIALILGGVAVLVGISAIVLVRRRRQAA